MAFEFFLLKETGQNQQALRSCLKDEIYQVILERHCGYYSPQAGDALRLETGTPDLENGYAPRKNQRFE